MLQCVAVGCSGLQCVLVYCRMLQCKPTRAFGESVSGSHTAGEGGEWVSRAVCCSVLQCVAVFCSVLQCIAVRSSVMQLSLVCCSVLQRVAARCSVMQRVAEWQFDAACCKT